MALTQCRECGREVSIQAGACPHCGAPEQAGGMAPAVAASPTGASAFRRPPPPPTRAGATPHQSRESDEAPAQARVTKAAQEAAFRRRLIWGLAGVAIVLFALGLSRTLGSWVVLSPLALLCVVGVGLGLHTALRRRSLPFFPQTRRAHGLLLALGAVLVWVAASQLVPQSLEERKRLAEEQQQEAERQQQLRAQKRATAELTVVYEVRSDYLLSLVTYSTPGGIAQEQSPGSIKHDGPDGTYFAWRGPSMTVRPGTFLSVSGQLAGGGLLTDGSVTYIHCLILVNGTAVASVRSQGKYAVASCSGQA